MQVQRRRDQSLQVDPFIAMGAHLLVQHGGDPEHEVVVEVRVLRHASELSSTEAKHLLAPLAILVFAVALLLDHSVVLALGLRGELPFLEGRIFHLLERSERLLLGRTRCTRERVPRKAGSSQDADHTHAERERDDPPEDVDALRAGGDHEDTSFRPPSIMVPLCT